MCHHRCQSDRCQDWLRQEDSATSAAVANGAENGNAPRVASANFGIEL